MYRILGYLVKYKYKKMQNIDKWPCVFMNTDMLYFFYKDVIPQCTVLVFYETTGTLSSTQKNGHKLDHK